MTHESWRHLTPSKHLRKRKDLLKEMEFNSPPFKHALQKGTSFQKAQCGEGGQGKLHSGKSWGPTLGRWSRRTWTVVGHTDDVYPSSDVMRMAFYPGGAPPKNTQPQPNRKRSIRKRPTEEKSKKIRLRLFKTFQVIKHRNCHYQEEAKETWELNGTWYDRWDPRKVKRSFGKKNKKKTTKFEPRLIIMYQHWYINYNKHSIIM